MNRQRIGAGGYRSATRDERGSAGAVLVIGAGLAIFAVFCVATVLIHWFAVARQAEQAAELSALAGASAAVSGAAPCPAAREAAERNGVKVADCTVRGSGTHVVVEVSVRAEIRPVALGAPKEVVREATAASY